MRVLALDLSLVCSGLARVQTSPAERTLTTIESGSRRGPNRLGWILRQIAAHIRDFDPDLIVLEGYAYARANQAHQIGELGGVVRLWLHEQGVRWVEVAPTALKKYATGKGNCSKEEVLVEAVKRLGYTGASNDEADALWLATMGLEALGAIESPVPKSHRSALSAVSWPELTS